MKKILVSILIFGLIAVLGVVFWQALPRIPSRNVSWETPGSSVAAVGDFLKNLISPNKLSILILGKPGKVEGQASGGEELTDTIMVAHFDSDSGKAFLVSIPRDLWVAGKNEQFKLNEMLSKDKADVLANKIENITGILLDGYVIVDLAMVKNAIDYLGGIDVVLSKPAVDWVSGYTLAAGAHHLNGDDAVWLIRNRYDKEGDFFREKNQQQVILDLFEKFKKMSTAEKVSFIDKFIIKSGLLKTSDLDVPKLTAYAISTDLSRVVFKNIVMDSSTKLFKTDTIPVRFGTSTQNVSIVIPVQGFEKYGDIKNYLKEQLVK